MVKGWLDVGDKICVKGCMYIVKGEGTDFLFMNLTTLAPAKRFYTLTDLNIYVFQRDRTGEEII